MNEKRLLNHKELICMVLIMAQNDDGDVRAMSDYGMYYVHDIERGLRFAANRFENEDGWIVKTGSSDKEWEKTIEVDTQEEALKKYFYWSVGIGEFSADEKKAEESN